MLTLRRVRCSYYFAHKRYKPNNKIKDFYFNFKTPTSGGLFVSQQNIYSNKAYENQMFQLHSKRTNVSLS
jgi:uncharacterized protein YukJ